MNWKEGGMYFENTLSNRIILAAIEVHRDLSPGHLESAYEECLCRELELQGVAFKRQVTLPLAYKGVNLDCGYRLDIVVESKVALELKSVVKFEPIHQAQLLTYLKLSGLKLGMLLNFNVPPESVRTPPDSRFSPPKGARSGSGSSQNLKIRLPESLCNLRSLTG
jgi:GxxExxY protein